MNTELIVPLLAAAIQSGTPILYATLGEILTEKSGVLNLGVEGMMITGALAAFVTAQATGNPGLAFLVAGLIGAAIGAIHAIVCLWFLGNQVVSGLALTIFGMGLADYLGTPLIGQTAPGFNKLAVPLLHSIPGLGPILFQQDILVYGAILMVPLLWFFLEKCRWGLNLRAVGEHPEAAAGGRYQRFAVPLDRHLGRWLPGRLRWRLPVPGLHPLVDQRPFRRPRMDRGSAGDFCLLASGARASGGLSLWRRHGVSIETAGRGNPPALFSSTDAALSSHGCRSRFFILEKQAS
jgi:hypothetical protein